MEMHNDIVYMETTKDILILPNTKSICLTHKKQGYVDRTQRLADSYNRDTQRHTQDRQTRGERAETVANFFWTIFKATVSAVK